MASLFLIDMVEATRTEEPVKSGSRVRLQQRLWRYGPLLVWSAVIFFASSDEMSAMNTSRIVRPVLLWLFPSLSEEEIEFAHLMVRKAAHFTEYGVLALLAARAFLTSSSRILKHRWPVAAFLMVATYSLLDELTQSFVPSRTGTIKDSLIDIAGGSTALLVVSLWRRWSPSQARKTP